MSCLRVSVVDELKEPQMRPRLRVFIGNDGPGGTDSSPPKVSMELQEFTRILSDAIIWDRTWLQDLGDENIQISADLYEILVAYSQMRPSA